jgi:hypothetical protein
VEANNPFTEQVRLLVALLPSVAKQTCFALKGGTAINLFLRDMPRLSVDIDLTYLPVEDRPAWPPSILPLRRSLRISCVTFPVPG